MTIARGLTLVFMLLAIETRPAAAQWIVGAYAGDAATARNSLRVTSGPDDTAATISDVPYGDESSRSPIYYGLRVARFLARAPRIGIETEFIHLKVITDPQTLIGVEGRLSGRPVSAALPLGAVLPRFEMSHGLNLLLGNIVFRAPVAAGQRGAARLLLTARGGAGLTVPHAEVTFRNRNEDGYRLGRPAWHASIGVEWRVWRNVHLMSEAKWTQTRQRLDAAGAHIEGTFRTRHLVAGVAYSLAPSARHRPFIRGTAF